MPASGAGEMEHTSVSIYLECVFGNPMYAAFSSAIFGHLSHPIMDAFEKRAIEVYGTYKDEDI